MVLDGPRLLAGITTAPTVSSLGHISVIVADEASTLQTSPLMSVLSLSLPIPAAVLATVIVARSAALSVIILI